MAAITNHHRQQVFLIKKQANADVSEHCAEPLFAVWQLPDEHSSRNNHSDHTCYILFHMSWDWDSKFQNNTWHQNEAMIAMTHQLTRCNSLMEPRDLKERRRELMTTIQWRLVGAMEWELLGTVDLLFVVEALGNFCWFLDWRASLGREGKEWMDGKLLFTSYNVSLWSNDYDISCSCGRASSSGGEFVGVYGSPVMFSGGPKLPVAYKYISSISIWVWWLEWEV